MLKAYNYVESTNLAEGIVDRNDFNTERKIASKYARENPPIETGRDCVICGSKKHSTFAEIDGIIYRRCEDCCSIYLPIDTDIPKSYQKFNDLVQFRLSDEFQNHITEKRKKVWDELLFWIHFRSIRYLSRNSNLCVIDYGNYYKGLSERIRTSSFCGEYYLYSSILGDNSLPEQPADVILFLDKLRNEVNPMEILKKLNRLLSDDGILIISTRVSSGFDILALDSRIDNIYPYEYAVLPSAPSMENFLSKAGFSLIEISTPGVLDVKQVFENKDKISDSNLFMKYFFETANNSALMEFQRFLQKNGLSSHARIIARKNKNR